MLEKQGDFNSQKRSVLGRVKLLYVQTPVLLRRERKRSDVGTIVIL